MTIAETAEMISRLNILEEGYRRLAPQLGPRPVVVVEGGYFDAREYGSRDRAVQLEDSIELIERLHQLDERPLVLPTALINDFGTSSRKARTTSGDEPCVQDHCEAASEVGSLDRDSADDEWIPLGARKLYRAAELRGIPPKKTFKMARERNRAAKWIRNAIKRGDSLISVGAKQADDSFNVEAIVPDYASVPLATIGPPPRMAIRCAALMAQHYFDLGSYARQTAPDLTGLVIIDFVRYNERERVQRGAETSLSLYPWPQAIPTWVVNCTYSDESLDPIRPLQLTPPVR
jgi:hypothetical protein